MNPSQLENALNHHFALLYNINDIVAVAEPNFSLDWLHCALTEKGRAVLIETDSPRSPFLAQGSFERRIHAGRIRMEEIDLKIDESSRKFIAFYCRRRNLVQLFNRLMADIVWHLLNEGPQSGDPWSYLAARLDGWRSLFSGTDNKAEEKGLIGELYVLRHLMSRHSLPVTIWSGPFAGVKDFRIHNQNIEVKTTEVRNGYLVEFSSLYQTSLQQQVERLVFIRLEETANGALSVHSLTQELHHLASISGQTAELQRRLEAFSPDVFTSPNRWELLEAVIMEMGDQFPRLSEQSFVNSQLPDGVLNIKWTGDLAALPKTPFMNFDFV